MGLLLIVLKRGCFALKCTRSKRTMKSSMDFKSIFFFGFQIGSGRYVGTDWKTGDFQSQNNFPFQAPETKGVKLFAICKGDFTKKICILPFLHTNDF